LEEPRVVGSRRVGHVRRDVWRWREGEVEGGEEVDIAGFRGRRDGKGQKELEGLIRKE